MKRAYSLQWGLPVLAILTGLVGFYGPWVPHKAAGLVVIGLDLAEYVKFLPQVRSGQIAIARELYYLPLFTASLAAGLLASRRTLPAWARVLAGLLAIPVALAMLPPAWTPSSLMQPEFRLQTIGITFCVALVPATVATRFVPDRIVWALVSVTCLLAAVVPAWQFIQVRPAIDALYRQNLPLGWGFWLSLLGFLLAAAIAGVEFASLRSGTDRRNPA